MAGIIFDLDPDTYFSFDNITPQGLDNITSGSFKNDRRTRQINNARTVYNFFEVKEGKIVGGCMDLGLYTVVPFESRFVWRIDGDRVKHYTEIPQYYPEGTLVFRRSGAYHKSEKVISITTTSDSITITTNQGAFLFNGVTSFIRKIKQGEEAIHTTIIGTKMTHWTQEERDSLEIN